MIECATIGRIIFLINDLLKKYKWSRGVDDVLNALGASNERIQSIIREVNQNQTMDENRIWIQQLKDATYEFEDVLDLFSYLDLQSEIQPRLTRSLSSLSRTIKILSGFDGPVKKLKSLLKRLNDIDIKESSNRLSPPAQANCAAEYLPMVGPFPVEDKMIGREKEYKVLVTMLIGSGLERSNNGNQIYSIAAVTGCAGMGKTTLAQFAFNDPRIKKHFNVRLWVTNPEQFKEDYLTMEIISSIGNDEQVGSLTFPSLKKKHDEQVGSLTFPSLSSLQEKLELMLENSEAPIKFLLVLDDVRLKEGEISTFEDKINNVLAPLRKHADAASCRILVTTRQPSLAKEMDVSNVVCLEQLTNHDEWLLLMKHALGKENSKADEDCNKIGWLISEKLNGLPLAAKIVGGVLRRKREKTYWQKVLEKNMYGSIDATIKSSYRKLPEHLQRCFAYCTIFPRNYMFDPKKLVKMWMAHNLIIEPRDQGGPCLEDLGLEYVKELESNALLQIIKQGHRAYYCVNNIMFDLAPLARVEECMRFEGRQLNDVPLPPTVRHLSVTTDCLSQLKNHDGLMIRKLRSLVVIKNHSSDPVNIEDALLVLKKLKCVRLLDLSGCEMADLPETLGQLIHLRYLAFCMAPPSTALPKLIIKLLHLQTLYMPHKCRVEQVPKGMNQLINMRHLNINTECIANVSGIGRMVNLHCSVEFHVKKDIDGHGLEELENLNDIGGEVTIKKLENVRGKEESDRANLKYKKRIKVLKLEWSAPGIRNLHRSVESYQVLDSLEPAQDLLELHIKRYPGNMSPQWLENGHLSHLKKIYLINCRGWEVLPPLGQLPSLKVLHAKEMNAVKKIGPEFYGTEGEGKAAFPKLEELFFDDMPECNDWCPSTEPKSLFPTLKKIKITNCPKLVEVPPVPVTVTQMDAVKNGFISYLKMRPYNSSRQPGKLSLETSSMSIFRLLCDEQKKAIESLAVRSCEAIESLTVSSCEIAGDATNGDNALTSLERLSSCNCGVGGNELNTLFLQMKSLIKLQIKDCQNITSLRLMQEPNILRHLHVENCENLSSLTIIHDSPSLQTLIIKRCPNLEENSLPSNLRNLLQMEGH